MENERVISSGVEFDKNKMDEILNLQQKTDDRLKEIEEKYKDNESIILRAQYILGRKEFLISNKYVIQCLFHMDWQNVLSSAESKELNSLCNDIYHKMLELENKLEEYTKTL